MGKAMASSIDRLTTLPTRSNVSRLALTLHTVLAATEYASACASGTYRHPVGLQQPASRVNLSSLDLSTMVSNISLCSAPKRAAARSALCLPFIVLSNKHNLVGWQSEVHIDHCSKSTAVQLSKPLMSQEEVPNDWHCEDAGAIFNASCESQTRPRVVPHPMV